MNKLLCRICLSKSDELISLTKFNTNLNHIELSKSGKMFQKCLDIKIEITQEYKLCMECIIQLKYFHDFKEKALEANKKFFQLYNQTPQNEEKNKSKTERFEKEKLTFLKFELDVENLTNEEIKMEIQEKNDEVEDEKNKMLNLEIEYLDDIENLETLKQYSCKKTTATIGQPFSCHICDKSYRIQSLLKDHLETHNVVKCHECTICNQKYKTRIGLRIHIKTVHSDGFLCNLCGKIFKRKPNLKDHILTHETKTGVVELISNKPEIKCIECGKTYKQKKSLIYHIQSSHTNERNFQCELCPKKFVSNGDLKIHMRVHNDERRYACDICDKRFRAYTHMTDHRYMHFENSSECPQCLVLFSSPRILRAHIRSVHDKICPHECKVCNKKFKRKHHLDVHSKVHSKIHTKNNYKLSKEIITENINEEGELYLENLLQEEIL